MDYVEHPTDQQIYDAGLTRAGYRNAYQSQVRTKRLEENRQANFTAGVSRSSSRFYEGGVPISKSKAWQIANAQVEAPTNVSVQAPIQPPVKPKVDAQLAREAYLRYHDTAANGVDRGKALHTFGCALGLCRSTACGFESETEVNATVEAIQSEAAAIKYGFDHTGAIARKAAASRVVSNQQN